MGEMVEMFKERREEVKQMRRSLLEQTEDRFAEIQTACREQGLEIAENAPGHYLVRRDGSVVCQYWPSARKWQLCGPGRRGVHKGDLDRFISKVRSGAVG